MGTDALGSDPTAGLDGVLGYVVVGVDETPESVVAVAQAGLLRPPAGRLVLVAVAERHLAAHAGLVAVGAAEHMVTATSGDLELAGQLVDADETVLASGRLVEVLRRECLRRGAKLMAVGVRPHRRFAARLLGDHDVEALRRAPCSVLIARPGWGPHRPERIVVAVDGSPESHAAEAVARSLAGRLRCEVLPVVGLADAASQSVLRAERVDGVLAPGRLGDAVASAAGASCLVVVGRAGGPDGTHAGGVADQIVHRVRCSVLVVRHERDAGRSRT